MAEGYYDSSVLQTSAKDRVRFLVKDTGPDGFIFGDDEIEAVLALWANGDALRAAMILVQSKAVEISGSEATSVSLGDASVSMESGVEHWRKLGAYLERLWATQGGLGGMRGPGGVAWEDVPHIFAVGQHDTPGSTASTWSSERDRLER